MSSSICKRFHPMKGRVYVAQVPKILEKKYAPPSCSLVTTGGRDSPPLYGLCGRITMVVETVNNVKHRQTYRTERLSTPCSMCSMCSMCLQQCFFRGHIVQGRGEVPLTCEARAPSPYRAFTPVSMNARVIAFWSSALPLRLLDQRGRCPGMAPTELGDTCRQRLGGSAYSRRQQPGIC